MTPMTPTNPEAVERLIERLREAKWQWDTGAAITLRGLDLESYELSQAADALTAANARVAELEAQVSRLRCAISPGSQVAREITRRPPVEGGTAPTRVTNSGNGRTLASDQPA